MTSEVVSSVSAEEEPTTTSTTTSCNTTVITTTTTVNTLEVPKDQNGFKSWMPYTALSRQSENYKLLKQYGRVDENGLWRINDYYCVALGSYYSKRLGEIFRIKLSSGSVIEVITVDHKADIHTDVKNQVTTANGCITEFIVDTNKLNRNIRIRGTVGVLPELSGTVEEITRLSNYYDSLS